MIRRNLVFAVLVFLLMRLGIAETLLVAAGAGYKRPVFEMAVEFERKTGIRVEQIYGHMAGVVEQARQSGQVAVVFGDLFYLEKVQGISFAGFLPLGEGRLVVGWPKGGELKAVADLVQPRFARIAIPDTKSAIFGIAANEFIQRNGLASQLQSRLQVVATVPQVSAYLISGDVDAGFINLTEALANKDKIGGYLEIDRGLYPAIRIVGAIVQGFEQQASVMRLRKFLESPEARDILDKHGL